MKRAGLLAWGFNCSRQCPLHETMELNRPETVRVLVKALPPPRSPDLLNR